MKPKLYTVDHRPSGAELAVVARSLGEAMSEAARRLQVRGVELDVREERNMRRRFSFGPGRSLQPTAAKLIEKTPAVPAVVWRAAA